MSTGATVAAVTNGATQGITVGQPNTAAPPPGQPAAPIVPASPAAKPAEPYKFKREISLGGKKVPVELDELGLEREIATGRSAQQQVTKLQKQAEQFAEMNRLLEAGDFDALARMKGADFEAYLAQRQARAAKLAELTPEQQEIVQLREQLAAGQRRQQAEEQQRQAQAKQTVRQQAQARTKAELFESLKHVGYKLDGPENAQARGTAIASAARIQKAAILAGRPPLTPQQLGAEVTRAFLGDVAQAARAVSQHPEFRGKHGKEVGAVFESLTHGLEGDSLLDSMGPALLGRIVQAQLAQLGRKPLPSPSGGGVVQQPGGILSAPVSNEQGGQVLDFYTLEAQVRKARGG